MKIAYISYPSFADCDYPLIRSLRKLGHNVYYYLILTPSHCHSTLVDINKLIPSYCIIDGTSYPELSLYDNYLESSTIRIVNFGGNKKIHIFLLWEKLRKEIKQFSPDIVHITHFFPPYGIPFYFTFKKLVITIHDPIPHSGEESSWNEKLRNIGIRFINCFLFLSKNDTLKTKFIERYNVSEKAIHYAGLAPYELLNYLPPTHTIDTDYHSDFLFIGRISPYKGVDVLLNAADLLNQKGLDFKIIIAGAGDISFDKRLSTPSHKNIIVINRYISVIELVSMMKNTRYVVCPYKEATQSGVIMSALALNRPVIATRVGDFENVIIDKKNGILLDSNDAEALANIMENVLQSPSFAHTEQDFTQDWTIIAQQYIKIYRDFIKT